MALRDRSRESNRSVRSITVLTENMQARRPSAAERPKPPGSIPVRFSYGGEASKASPEHDEVLQALQQRLFATKRRRAPMLSKEFAASGHWGFRNK